jgi:5-methylcytosine-specific restriction endonuclease McrA
MSTGHPCLLLSYDYVPLRVIDYRQTFKLVFSQRAQIVELYQDKVVRTVSRVFKIPAVIRLLKKFRNKFPVKLSRRTIMIRDEFTCQYCGKSLKHLTVDHCIPKSRGGGFSWDNIVTSCIRCNTEKDNRTPEEAGMSLLSTPRKMDTFEYIRKIVMLRSKHIPQWKNYMPS